MTNQKSKIAKKNIFAFYFVVLIIIFSALISIYREISTSVFLRGRGKINVLVYNESTRFYSLDLKNVNYLLFFPNSMKVVVPGGYGRYKVGAVGKLASLEDKPTIIKDTFSAASSTLVDLYFYPKTDIVYQQDSLNDREIPSFKEIFFTNSNANFVDKITLYLIFATSGKEDYQKIDLQPYISNDQNNSFDYNGFYKQFQGSFFQKSYRDDDTNVQVLYSHSYSTALLFSQVIEGEGIRVVDLSSQDGDINGCLLTANKNTINGQIFRRLETYFKCHIKVGETTVSDIILEMGDLEKEWAVK